MATEKKEERINEAEMNKQATQGRPHYSNTTTGPTGHSTGLHQMSALPDHGTGEPMGQVTDGVVQSQSHPIRTATGTQRASTAHNTRVGGGINQGYGTGGNYS
ncbi:DRE binding factor 1 [Capsicum annuum]|nr:DRE binding factor 1 [Capsicum annuum]KAF3675932.1 DRE binding factor 1 [Capsicum annuum]